MLLTAAGAPRKTFNRSVGVLPRDKKRPELEALKRRIETAAEQFAECGEVHAMLHAARELPAPRYEDVEWRVLRSLLLVLRIAAAELKAVFAERHTAGSRLDPKDRRRPGFRVLLPRLAHQLSGLAFEPLQLALADLQPGADFELAHRPLLS